MTRRFVKLAAALLIAILVNYLIAWATWIPIKYAKLWMEIIPPPHTWPAPAPGDWPNPSDRDIHRALGVRVEVWDAMEESPDGKRHYFSVCHYDSGWPCVCMRRTQWGHEAFDPRSSTPMTSTFIGDSLPSPSWWNSGAPMPPSLDHIDPGWKRLPIRPIPLPFLANTALWFLILLSPFALAKRIRHRNRRHTNRCIPCGYNRAGLAPDTPCPECGHATIS